MKTKEQNYYGMYKVKTHLGPGPIIMGTDTLVANPIFNLQNESLGKVYDIMLNMHTGRVAYVVLASGGYMGMGERLIPIPWDAMVLDTLKNRLTLDVNADQLERAPSFQCGNWLNMADQIWANRVHTYYNTKLYLDNIRL
jgi:hypothetical protein